MPNIDYDTPYQTSLISMLLSDPAAWETCSTFFKAEYFDDGLKIAVRYITNYREQYGKLPSMEQFTANTHGVEIPKFSELVEHTEATIDDFEGFVKYRAMENLVLDRWLNWFAPVAIRMTFHESSNQPRS